MKPSHPTRWSRYFSSKPLPGRPPFLLDRPLPAFGSVVIATVGTYLPNRQFHRLCPWL